MTKFAVYAVPAFGITEVQDVFDTFAEAEACAVALNGKDDGYDYRVDELVDTNLITDDDIGLLSSLHYYGWEFPGNTWDGIPPEIVKACLWRACLWRQTGQIGDDDAKDDDACRRSVLFGAVEERHLLVGA